MAFALESKTTNCVNCYKCIRNCPVKAITFNANRARIINDECILCGACFLTCPQKLKSVRDDLELVKDILNSGSNVVISLAPSFVSYYKGVRIDDVKNAILKIGVSEVEETAIGATIVKKAYDEFINNNKFDVLISSCCHSVNLLIEKHYKEAIPYLAPVYSPMVAHGKDIKARYGEDTKVIFVGPCISKKDEQGKYKEYIDAVLTFEELDRLFVEHNIELEVSEEEKIEENSKARLFPTTGGILKTMDCSNPKYTYLSVDGVDECISTLKDIIDGKIHNCFIEMSACHGSCVNGPLTHQESIILNTSEVVKKAGDKDFENYKLESKDIETEYQASTIFRAKPSPIEIERMLEKMDKADPKRQLNCSCCGYATCRDKAIAIIEGKAHIEMCLPMLMERTKSFSDQVIASSPNGIIVCDDNLNIQLINKEMCNIIGISNPRFALNNNISTILNPLEFIEALNGKQTLSHKVYLSDYDKYVEESVLFNKDNHFVVCFMKDITKRENLEKKNREILNNSLKIADDVMTKNMRTVQEIASLLGEGAAETKVALTKLKDSLKND